MVLVLGIFAVIQAKKQTEIRKKHPGYPKGYWMNHGIGIGIATGAGIGVAMGNLAIGVAIGVAIGTAIGSGLEKKHKDEIRPITDEEKTLKKQAKDEETQARERELQRKTKINKILAAQIAGLGASGISAEGSPQLIAQESLREESLAGLADVATRSGRERNLSAQGSAARKLGNINAATGLLSTASNIGIGLATKL